MTNVVVADIAAKAHFFGAAHISVAKNKLTLVETNGTQEGVIYSLILSGKLSSKDYEASIKVSSDENADVKKFLIENTVVIDAQDVSSPEPSLTLSSVISEELAFAGKKSGFKAIDAVLDKFDAKKFKNTKFGEIPNELRFRVLVDIASSRGDILLWVHPDHHEPDSSVYLGIAKEYVKAGKTVVLFVRKGVVELGGKK
jgi:hypothetical protein